MAAVVELHKDHKERSELLFRAYKLVDEEINYSKLKSNPEQDTYPDYMRRKKSIDISLTQVIPGCRTGEAATRKLNLTDEYLKRVNKKFNELYFNRQLSKLVQGLLDFE